MPRKPRPEKEVPVGKAFAQQYSPRQGKIALHAVAAAGVQVAAELPIVAVAGFAGGSARA